METFDEAHHADRTAVLDYIRRLTDPVIDLAPTASYVRELQQHGRVIRLGFTATPDYNPELFRDETHELTTGEAIEAGLIPADTTLQQEGGAQ